MRISKYLTYNEAVKSKTAIRKGIENKPNEEQLKANQGRNEQFKHRFLYNKTVEL